MPANTITQQQVQQELKQYFGFVPDFIKAIPQSILGPMWLGMRDFALAETAIPNKYKELIGLATAAHIKCRYCIYFHTQAARMHGATEQEVREACMMSGYTTAWSNVLTGAQLDLDAFKGEVDRALAFVQKEAAAHPPH
jgi:AhpD family alkylhydroperoxidase